MLGASPGLEIGRASGVFRRLRQEQAGVEGIGFYQMAAASARTGEDGFLPHVRNNLQILNHKYDLNRMVQSKCCIN